MSATDRIRETTENERIVVIGAGIAGLSAAYRLSGITDAPLAVYEKENYIGGICRTVCHNGFRFDLGGHRFYTKKAHVQRAIEELLGADLVEVDRVSRILFNGRFIDYPLSGFNALKGLGLWGAVRAVWDYAFRRFKGNVPPPGQERNFEDWVLGRFGQYLYRAYFKTYTEKLWGIPCTEISPDFAEQRIKGLSFTEAVREALFKKSTSTSLVRRFLYPRLGFGQIPDAFAAAVLPSNRILLGHRAVGFRHDEQRITSVVFELDGGGRVEQPCSHVLSSVALPVLVEGLQPPPPSPVLEAARRLRYRDMVILFLTIDRESVSRDNWIYFPSAAIGFARLHEPKNWSRHMSPPDKTSLVLEYFCQEGDCRWNQPGSALAAEAARELGEIGLIRPEEVTGFTVVHIRKAYPIYRVGYENDLEKVRSYLAGFANLQNIGRSAGFCYTSSDNYVDMGFKAAENVMGAHHDLACVGREEGYAEELSGEAL